MVINDRGFSEFCKQPFLHTESVHTIAPFWGIKSAELTFFSTLRTVANVLLDGLEAILEKRCKCLFIQS